ncbi:hypothetical protein BH11BAC7_BH11BAC7_15700 [soil metagenome]
MSKEKNKSTQIPGGIISSREDWNNIPDDSMDLSYDDRLTQIELLRLQYMEMFNIPNIPDMTVFGKRETND